MNNQNEFILYVGPMFSGKTERLIDHYARCAFQKKRAIAFKPYIDKRYSESNIISHNGKSIPAINVETGNDIIIASESQNYDTICIDEAFMIPGVALASKKLFFEGKTIIISSLDLSAKMIPFEEISIMMPFATKIEKVAACCNICGGDARYSFKAGGDANMDLEIGGNDMYEARCLYHYLNG